MAAFIAGCDSKDGEGADDTQKETSDKPDTSGSDDYDEYIRSSLDSMNGSATASPTPAANDGKAVSVDRNAAGDDFYVSAADMGDDLNDPYSDQDSFDPFATPTPDPELSPSPTEDPNATPTPSPTPYITPEEFEVGKSLIYINGESDSAYGTEIITAINKARTDLGYPPLITNKGLTTCADRRTREIAASLSHTRPNGQPFYSLAPEHFKAEMLVINKQKAEETVDVMIKKDPISRALIFTEKYQSIGASSFKCNGMNCTVVSFGL